MDRPQTDPKLGEVRAVLQRLQTFSAEPNKSPLPDEAGAGEPRAPEPSARRRAPAAIGLTIAATAFVVLVASFGLQYRLPIASICQRLQPRMRRREIAQSQREMSRPANRCSDPRRRGPT